LDIDQRFRLAVFDWLRERTLLRPERTVTWNELVHFEFERERAPLIGAQGIWNPRQLSLPISVATAPPKPGRDAPYADEAGRDGTLLYRYRGTDPQHPRNVALRELLALRRPLVYFYGIDRGLYCASWPAYVVHDDPRRLTFTLQIDDELALLNEMPAVSEGVEARRRYVTALSQRRLHQAGFRARVMRAYRQRCAVCRIGHEDLLDAAHILPDRDPRGVPTVRNGLSLCKIHHAAFDANILGIDPKLVVHVREDILREKDGPMLVHGIQATDGRPLAVVPRRPEERPEVELLEVRYEAFRRA
jgi:putative restriction endonuclease